MGYRSDVIIALNEKIIFRDLVTQEIPKIIKELPFSKGFNATYYKVEDWKWYHDYTDVREIEDYFFKLSEEDEILFGAIRVGESAGDIEEWGNPHEYELYAQTSIDCPVGF